MISTITPTPTDSAARASTAASRGVRLVTFLAGGWALTLTWWVAENYTRLGVARALVEREGAERGAPLTADDHLADFPELYAEFADLGLLGNGTLIWIFGLGIFAAAGLAIAAAATLAGSTPKRQALSAMAAMWAAAVALALANGETLELLMWLNN